MGKREINKVIALTLFLDLFLTACSLDTTINTKEVRSWTNVSTNTEDLTRYNYQSTTKASVPTTEAYSQPTTMPSTTRAIEPSTNRQQGNAMIGNSQLTEAEMQLYTKKFSVSSGAFNSCLERIGSINIPYDYENYFNINDNTNFDYTPAVKAGTIIKNGKVDANTLIQYVLKNNADYLSEYGDSNYGSTTSSDVNKICREIADELNYYMAKNNLDLDLLEEKLQSLKVFLYSGFGKGVYISDNGIFKINVSDINDKRIDSHETIHLIQSASPRELRTNGYMNRLGYCYQTSKTSVNPYNFLWLEEIAAESLGTMDYLKQGKPSTYENWYDALVKLKTACFDGDFAIESTTLQKDISTLYDCLGATKNTAKNNVQKMLYTINIMTDTSSDNESAIFYNGLGKDNFRYDYYRQRDIYSSYNCSIALTKAQIFYSKLARKLSNKSVTLNEVFSVITFFEKVINEEARYNSGNNGVDRYLEDYCNIQQQFFKVLADQLGISTESVILLYNNYYASATKYNAVSWLSPSENKLFNVQFVPSKSAQEVFAQKYNYSNGR